MSLKEVAFKEKCWRVTNTFLKDFFHSLRKWLVSLKNVEESQTHFWKIFSTAYENDWFLWKNFVSVLPVTK
jgi:hypothetical protein